MSGHKIYCADCVTKGTGRHEKEVNIPARCSVGRAILAIASISFKFVLHSGTKGFSFKVIYRYAPSRPWYRSAKALSKYAFVRLHMLYAKLVTSFGIMDVCSP